MKPATRLPLYPLMTSRHKKAATGLREQIATSNRLHRSYLDDPVFRRDYERFISLQTGYFLPQYDDLRDRPGYDRAIDFVVTDLTGTGIADRDRDLEKVAPIMSRTLPTGALSALKLAMELNARVLDMNLGIAKSLQASLRESRPISERDYCRASRSVTGFDDCRELIDMTHRAGHALDEFAHLPMIRTLSRSMRLPARVWGFTDLQAFLEKGLDTFLAVDDVPAFLDVMDERMTVIFRRVFEAPLEELDTRPLPSGG